MYKALVVNNKVQEILINTPINEENSTWVELINDNAQGVKVGWDYDGVSFTPPIPVSLQSRKESALAVIRARTGAMITEVGDWSVERQSNTRDGLYPNVVRPSDNVVFSFLTECKAWRASMIYQGDAYEDAINAIIDSPTAIDEILAISTNATYDTTGLLTYTQVKEQANG